MTDQDIRVPAAGLTAMLTRVFRAAGGSGAEAHAIAANLVEANLAGHDSHGVIRTQRYLWWQAQGTLNFGRTAETVLDAPGFALIEGHQGFGQTIGPQAVALGTAKARANRFAVIGLRNAGHLGRIGAFAETACAEGLISIHFVNVGNSVLVAPFGGAERRMATNPVCIGVPHAEGDFILDFATSKVAEGKILVARKGRKPAPKDSLIGPDGALSDDPDVLYGPEVPGKVDNPRDGPGALAPMGE
ncbi:MAG TPA: Ldh family oxidoreductase, partial [Thermohalobaculum sp.]|nr:Ldh family oxidoreductase [Thermohalobaculum sp.]